MTTRRYMVDGMTCNHCVDAVTGEIRKAGGIDDVIVDLQAGTVTVTAGSVDDAVIRSAIEEAGYEVVSRT